tara:strand:+ start:726 stop:971 length:246 start_codon:yes stop_codon:yes gene_type:complete
MIRSFAYWISTFALAFLAAHATGSEKAAEGSLDFATTGDALIHVLPVPEPARAAFLGIGIMAVAFTYRRAWLNLKRQSESH